MVEDEMHIEDVLDSLRYKVNLPIYAYLKGKGQVRVLEYKGNDQFLVLTSKDERVFVHRDRLKFKKDKKDV